MTDSRERRRNYLPRRKKSGDEDPRMIGQWKIGRTIGKGSSGRVKIARHVKTQQYAAVKIVSKTALINSRASMTNAPAQAEKILLGIEREIVIMKLIDHPNVLNLYDVWETANELYLIMEYVDGGELFDYLVSRGRIPVAEALHYFQQIIAAISYCHGFNIAHRDLKPENLLLSKSGTSRNIKVADFGMAAYTDASNLLSTSCGSPHYASPEVVEGKSYKGNVSDIWSCGVILYALLVGRLPFDHENLRVLLEKVKVATYEIPSDVPPAARDLISRMMEKDVMKRVTMPQILEHPFFLSATPPPSLLLTVQMPTLDQISSKHVQCEDEIDADIFDNIRTLWHGTPAKELLTNLLNDEKNWEKAVYHLLLKYRAKHLEYYDMDEDDESRRRYNTLKPSPIVAGRQLDDHPYAPPVAAYESPTQRMQTMKITSEPEDAEPSTSVRPSAPTPQRATWHADITISQKDMSASTSFPQHVPTNRSPVTIRRSESKPEADVFATTPRRDSVVANDRSSNPVPPPVLPVINFQEATPMRLQQIPVQSDVSSNVSSSPSPSPIFGLPDLVVPKMDNMDETVQRFFHQIVEHLNAMQMWQSSVSTRSSSATPETSSRDASGMSYSPRLSPEDAIRIVPRQAREEIPRRSFATYTSSRMELVPNDSRFEDATEEYETSSDAATEMLGLGISDHGRRYHEPPTALSPPFQQQQLRPPPPPGRAYSNPGYSVDQKFPKSEKRSHAKSWNKENVPVQMDISPNDTGMRKKSSLRSTEDGRRSFGDKRVQIVLPSGGTDTTRLIRKGSSSPRSAETSPTSSDGLVFLPVDRTPRQSWFSNLFKFKPASYHLLSVDDAQTTREECASLLRAFGISVLLKEAEGNGNGVLKCKLEEVRDAISLAVIAKGVRFRVELDNVTHAHSVSGYVTLLTMIQEKGALSSFKLVYNRLRREWDLDTPPSARTASSIY